MPEIGRAVRRDPMAAFRKTGCLGPSARTRMAYAFRT
ncbi:hypothetical protein FHU30_004458 [Actinomadura rupiterrae]|nr:hypothetical protein [Actinomadura rupiterrae]